MARPKVIAKTGGRKKGTPNKKTEDFFSVLESIELNLVDEVYKILPELSPEKRADVLVKLMEFAYPKRKALEAKAEPVSIHTSLVRALAGYDGEGDLFVDFV